MLVGVMTNGNHVQQTKKIERIGLENLLDAIFSSEMVGHAKPSAEAFLIPCESLQVPPDEVLYVGDNYRMDVEGARNAGLSAIHLDRAAADPGPRTVRTLTELPTILEKRPVNSANNRG
jgi:putative hydrolase of the HAD superfamily